MANYEPIEIHGYYRSHTHLPVWDIVEETGIWKELGIKASFEYCDSSSEAEAALFEGRVDFISGNHISPYALVARGKPIVSLASPSNSVNDKLISKQPIKSISELRGKRIADTTVTDQGGGYNHIRGNHMLYIKHGGISLDDVVQAIAAVTFFSAAYLAENVRGGLQAIPKGQYEASKALGMTTFQTTVFIVLPQALRAVVPALVGQTIAIFKDTSLVAIVGLLELLGVAQAITQQPAFAGQGLLMETLLFASLIFWVGSFTMSRESQRLEKRLGVGER